MSIDSFIKWENQYTPEGSIPFDVALAQKENALRRACEDPNQSLATVRALLVGHPVFPAEHYWTMPHEDKPWHVLIDVFATHRPEAAAHFLLTSIGVTHYVEKPAARQSNWNFLSYTTDKHRAWGECALDAWSHCLQNTTKTDYVIQIANQALEIFPKESALGRRAAAALRHPEKAQAPLTAPTDPTRKIISLAAFKLSKE